MGFLDEVDDMADPNSPNYQPDGKHKARKPRPRGCAIVTLPVVAVPLALVVLAEPGAGSRVAGGVLALGALLVAARMYEVRHRECCGVDR